MVQKSYEYRTFLLVQWSSIFVEQSVRAEAGLPMKELRHRRGSLKIAHHHYS